MILTILNHIIPPLVRQLSHHPLHTVAQGLSLGLRDGGWDLPRLLLGLLGLQGATRGLAEAAGPRRKRRGTRANMETLEDGWVNQPWLMGG